MKSLLLMVTVIACGSSTPPDLSLEQPGTFAVGTHATTSSDGARSRTLTVKLWFPTQATATAVPFEQQELGSNQATYAGLLAQAPECPTRMLEVAVDAQPMAGTFPAVVFSHCHSCGGVTAGRVAETDSRVAAAAALCAPMENPAIPGVTLANIHVPLMFIVADEDNSIGDLGNQFIAKNYGSAAPPVAKLEVPDAGHWSFSDEDGLIDAFAPGCGSGIRQTTAQPFEYLDPPKGRDIAAAYVTAFFKATLQHDAGAQAYVDSAHLGVTAAHRYGAAAGAAQ